MNINEIKNKLEKKASLKKVAGPLSKSVKTELSVIKDLLKKYNPSLRELANNINLAQSGHPHLIPPVAQIRTMLKMVSDDDRFGPHYITDLLKRLNYTSSEYFGVNNKNKMKFYDRLSNILNKEYDTLQKNFVRDMATPWKQRLINKYFDM